jgi:hypothetical protein
MLAHPPNNDCRLRQSLLGVVAKDMQGTTFRRLATNGGEKCGLVDISSSWSDYQIDTGNGFPGKFFEIHGYQPPLVSRYALVKPVAIIAGMVGQIQLRG